MSGTTRLGRRPPESISDPDGDDRHDGAKAPWSKAPWSTGRTLVAMLIALAVGAGIALAVTQIRGDDPASPPPADTASSSLEDRTATIEPQDLTAAGFRELQTPPTDIPVAPASDVLEAVQGFLTAEANERYDRSFEFLAADEQAQYGSPAGWIAAHANVLPPVTGFEIGEVTDGPDGPLVATVVGFRPSLDEIIGLVPAQAEVTWAVAEQDGAIGVSLERSSFSPIYLSEDSLLDAARTWVASRQSCEPAGEWGGTLLGVQGPVLELCGTDGAVELGTAEELPPLEAAPFVTAFGEDAAQWARVVTVDAPIEFRAVFAPIGPQWRAIGALPPGTLSTGG